MSSIEYNINFSGAHLEWISRSTEDEYKWIGSITFLNPVVAASVTVKPQLPNWWRNLAKKIGGEFKQTVDTNLPPSQMCPACNGMGITDSAHTPCFYCKGDGEI